ncbi:unnamed protein product [Paramecium primaurelia]|uniref:Uncharacterized protein n=1 Tax=Paramecium primaurelia TaxID=5886 RepID=A0A8S1LSA6_PARPR|nr:unnamed protein product [Paramecium primaurelia]
MSSSKILYSPSRSNVNISGADRALSPSRAKISQLSEKLSNLQHQVDEDQAFKKETFENRVKLLEDKATKQSQADDSKFKLLREQLQKIEEGAQNEKIIRETGDEKLRSKDLKLLEGFLGKELQNEKINRKDYEVKIIKNTDEKVYSLKLDLARQKKYREETEEKNSQEIGDRVLQLQEEVEEERRQREEQNQNTIKKLGDSILKLQEILTNEKKQRESAQGQMFRMLDEMNNYLNHELQNEKNEREATEESLINLIDQTCNRVENSLRK